MNIQTLYLLYMFVEIMHNLANAFNLSFYQNSIYVC